MDIPLPDDEPPINENLDESLADIPVPEDTNRYSPSLPIEDDPTELENDISTISLPSETRQLPVPPTVSVLGKEAAKKRLLAFSQAKHSFISQKRKPSIQSVLEGNVLKDSDPKSIQAKKKKKGVLDKARDTISQIEELKRRENEVLETMQVLFPMWSNLDKKTAPVTSLIVQDGIVERSDRIESVVEKLLSKKSKHEKKEQERMERLEERKRKRERREKEIRRLMPKSWKEFNKSGFKAYHFRRQKFRLEKLSENTKPKERTRSHEHEREGSKRSNLLDTPMVLKKPLLVSGVNNEDIEFPSWAVRYTNTWPSLSYCMNPKYDTRRYISRKEMLSTLPDNIYPIIKKFLSSSCLNKFKEGNPESNHSWWEQDSFLISKCDANIESLEERNFLGTSDPPHDVFQSDFKPNESSDFNKEKKSEEWREEKSSTKSASDVPSSEGANSDAEKSYSSDMSENETMDKASVTEGGNRNEENLASEYEQFIKTIGPSTDDKESCETTARSDQIWSGVPEEKEMYSESSPITQKEVEERKKFIKDKKLHKEKRKKVKKKKSKRSHSSDSSSSDSSSSSSRSSSSSSDSSSSTTTSSSSSSSGSSSSSSSSSSASSSSSNDSSSESSTSTSSSGSTTSSDSQSFEAKTKKKLRKKRLFKKKIISSGKNKNKKASKGENEDEKSFLKKKKKRKGDLMIEGMEKSDNEAQLYNLNNLRSSPEKSFTELVEGEEKSLTSKHVSVDPSIIVNDEKLNQEEMYEPRDSSPQSRTSDEGGSTLTNCSLKSATFEPVLSNEQKDTNNSLHWNSGEESVSNLPIEQDIVDIDLVKPPEGKRHFNIDMFQESHNCTPDISNARDSPIENLCHNDFKEESKGENDTNRSRSSLQAAEESALKSLERYSPTAEDQDEEEYEDFLTNNTSGGGSTLGEASQLVSFGVNSASEEARMLDIPLPPPIEAPSEAPTSFRNILQLPSSPNRQPHQLDIKKKNVVLVGKSPVARLTFGKQVMKLKPISIFSAEDSDSEADKTPFPLSAVSETNDASSLSSSGAVENKEDNCTQASVNSSQIANEIINSQVSVSDIDASTSNVDVKQANVVLDSSSPLSKKSRWDQETLKSEERDCIGDVAERSLLINPVAERTDISERKVPSYQSVLSVPELLEKVKGKTRKEGSHSPVFATGEKKRRRERSHSSERDRRRRERAWSPRDRSRFSRRETRRDFRKRSHSKERRNRRDSPSWRKSSPQTKSSRRSLSQEGGDQRKIFEKSIRNENMVTNHDALNEPSTTFDSSWNKSDPNFNEIKDSHNSSPKKKESLSDWDSPERKYSPSNRKESPKRKKSPVLRDSPFRSPRRKESPMRKRTPENRKESPNRRYSPRRSPLPWKRSPDRRRSSPSRRRLSPDRKRPGSPYRRRSSPSPERKYSGRYSRKSPMKHQAYSNSPSREEKWKWEEGKESEKRVDGEHFPKWNYEAPQAEGTSDYQTSLADSTISDSELVKEPSSPKRMSLDERLKIELGHSSMKMEALPQEQPQNIPAFHNFYYPPPTVVDRVGYFQHEQYNVNPAPPPCLPHDWNPSLHPPQLPNKLVQVGNVLQVVPTEIPVEPVFSAPPPKIVRNIDVVPPKVLQVGNVLQVVPSQEAPPPPPLPQSVPLPLPQLSADIKPPTPVAAPIPKVTAPAPPVSIISLPFPPGSPNVFMKLEEKERRKKEKELRKERKEQKVARRMLRKALLKKRLAKANEPDNEDLTCGIEANENESGDPDTSKGAVVLPSPDKGILIGLKDTIVLTSTKKKSVSFADGIKPGEGTSPSGGEEHPLSPPPLIRKPVKKRKKRKVKVRIIRIDSNSKEEESDEDELSPPPPPPGTPPPEAYIEYTASGRYLYPVVPSHSFSGNQEGTTVFPALPGVSASPVQFAAPPLPQPR